MRTLHRYLFRELLTAVVMTVVVFTAVLLLGTLVKEVVMLVVSGVLTPADLARALALLIPYVWAYALPMGMLTAALLTFGRWSADQELIAARASGIGLIALISPALWLSVGMAALSAVCTLEVSPACREAYRTMRDRIVTERPLALLMEDRYLTLSRAEGDLVLYAGRIRGSNLNDVLLYQLGTNGALQTYLHASRGTVRFDPAQRTVTFQMSQPVGGRFEDGRLQPMPIGGEWTSPPIPLEAAQERTGEPRVGGMRFGQLRARIAALRAAGMDATPALVELHQRLSLAFSCISFTVAGIPLAIRAHRRETSVGVALGLVLMLVFHGFFIAAQSLKTNPEYLPHLIAWVPNFLLFAVGLPLLRRANRGF
jgi:lipopolysaccharide export system permease protein